LSLRKAWKDTFFLLKRRILILILILYPPNLLLTLLSESLKRIVNVSILEALNLNSIPLLSLLNMVKDPITFSSLLLIFWLILNYSFSFPLIIFNKGSYLEFFFKFPKLILSTLIVSLMIYLGLLVLLVPGIMIALGFSLLIPVVTLENLPFKRVFKRALELSQKRLRKLFLLLAPWTFLYIYLPSLVSSLFNGGIYGYLFLTLTLTFCNSFLVSALFSSYKMTLTN